MRDEELFSFIRSRYPRAGVADVELQGASVVVRTARPGVLIGRQGKIAEQLTAELRGLRGPQTELRMVELSRPELEAVLVADDVAGRLATGAEPSRLLAMQAAQSMKAGAAGCRIVVSGALQHEVELGTLDEATVERFGVQAVFKPPYEVDDEGNEVVPPPQTGPLPAFEVQVSITRPPNSQA